MPFVNTRLALSVALTINQDDDASGIVINNNDIGATSNALRIEQAGSANAIQITSENPNNAGSEGDAVNITMEDNGGWKIERLAP